MLSSGMRSQLRANDKFLIDRSFERPRGSVGKLSVGGRLASLTSMDMTHLYGGS